MNMRPMVNLVLRVSASVAHDIDALGRNSRGSVVHDALMSFLNGDFDPFREGSGHADWSENWGRLLPRPVDTLRKVVKESLSIRIIFRLPHDVVSRIDTAMKRRDFRSRTNFVRSVLVAYLTWRSSRPDTLVKSAIHPAAVASVASNFSFTSGESEGCIGCGSLAPQ
jgi:hypothetical protein